MKLYFDDEAFDSHSSEVLVRPIQLWLTWVSAWRSPSRSRRMIATAGTGRCGFASRLADQGQTALAAGHRIRARSVLLWAAEYFRRRSSPGRFGLLMHRA